MIKGDDRGWGLLGQNIVKLKTSPVRLGETWGTAMFGCDRRLKMEMAECASSRRICKVAESQRDEALVPAGTVLIPQGDEDTPSIDPGRKRARLKYINASKASVAGIRVALSAAINCARRIASWQSSSRTGASARNELVPLVEKEIQCLMHGAETRTDLPGIVEVKQGM
jgi:hypothetical protein